MAKKQVVLRLLKLTVKLGITSLFAVLIITKIDYWELRESLHHANIKLLTLGLLLTPGIILCKISKWYLLLCTCDFEGNKFLVATKSFLIGYALAFVTPFASGEIARGAFIPSVSQARLLELTVRDKLCDLLGLLVYVSVALSLMLDRQWNLVMITIGTIALLSLVFFQSIVRKFKLSLAKLMAKRLPANGKEMLPIRSWTGYTPYLYAFLNLVGFLIFFIQQGTVIYGFLGWWDGYYAVLPIITLSTAIPITLGGFGIREWTAVSLLQRFQISPEIALNATLTHVMIVMLIPSAIGFGLLLDTGFKARTPK